MKEELINNIMSGQTTPKPLANDQEEDLNSGAEFEISDGISDQDRPSIPKYNINKVNPSSETKLKKMVSSLNRAEQNKSKKQIDDIWEKYDINNSGVLEKSEAFIFLRDIFRELFGTDSTDEDLESTFKMMDTNEDGVI